MKYPRTTLALAFALLLCDLPAQSQSVTTETDDFTGTERIVSGGTELQQDAFAGRAHARAVHADGSYVLVVEIQSRDGWQALGERQALFVAGDARASGELLRLNSDVQRGGGTYERYGVVISKADWAAIAQGSDARMRIASVVYALPAVLQEEIQMVAAEAKQ